MEIIDSLKEEVSKNNIEEAGSIVEKIGDSKLIEAVPILINILLDTESNQLRNTIAIALSDIGCDDAVVPIISLLKSPKTQNSRGTLLYALENFDCSDYGELITELLIKGNFEVRWQSISLLRINVKNMSAALKHNCRTKLQANLSNTIADEELQEALEILGSC
ncbi:HEAT repeat domain-containing protein [Paenibacillus chitinolyticus]|uniref:HEAT repeat domain-containing protein n=1 Tax=Paenibacillus chitinolyticus TaxID=79263 RepID=UPI00366FB91B